MAEKEVLGHIDCPACGEKSGMRVTLDKNGSPFGFCEANCDAQLRIGGSARRVAAFLRMYPWAAGKPVPDTAPAPVKNPVTVPDDAPEQRQKPRAGFAFGL
jgi:hypothetical protein